LSFLHLWLDFETSSPLDIKKVGLDRYARAATPLMLAWAVNDQPPQLWHPHEGPMPEHLGVLIRASGVVKIAWNATFERAIFLHTLGIDIPVNQWIDPSLMARHASITGSLALASEVLMLSEAVAKMAAEGKRLISKFSMQGKRGYRTPQEDPEDFAKFGEYCKQDVVAERTIFKMLTRFELSPFELRLWQLDQKINERGMPVDELFVQNGKKLAESERAEMLNEMKRLTGLDNPNSNKQLLAWMRDNGYPYASLGKDWVKKAITEVSNA
jgi:DNA polymerase bacteriophage-type